MKEKLINFFNNNKGNISLFVITFIATILFGAISSLFSVTELTQIVISLIGGESTLIGIEWLEEKVGMSFGNTKRSAIIGIMAGIIIMLI